MRRWIRQWLLRSQEERELSEELRAHLAIDTQQRLEAGESPEEAAHNTKRAFGNLTGVQEDVRETWGWAGLERFCEDVGFGVRMLRKTPIWTAVISITLALGIGLGAVIFSVVYSVLFKPLPYPGADRLVAAWLSAPKSTYARFYINAALWLDWQRDTTMLEDIALTRPIANFNLTGEGAPERLRGARASFNLPRVLRTQPLLGRVFTKEEQQSDARVAILSYAFWKSRFGSDPSVVGRKIQLNGEPFEVIGVMPSQYQYPSADFELWTPLYIPPDEIRDGMNYQYLCVGRLKSRVSLKQAQTEFSQIMQRVPEEHPVIYGSGKDRVDALLEPLAQSDAFRVRSTLYVLLGAVGCLLLIGCMNLAVLLIARANARVQEMAVRVALGATSSRVRRQLLAEVLPLSLIGTAGGLLSAWWMLEALLPYLPANTPRVASIGLHVPVILFAICVSLAVVLLAGLLPGRIATSHHPNGALQAASRSVTGGGQARNTLVVAQIAVSLILLIGGLLFVRSFSALLAVKPGFSTQGVLTMHLAVTREKYREDERVADYYRQIVDRVKSIQGVIAAGIVNRLPFTGIAQSGGVEFEGRQGSYDSDWRSATPGYFQAIGIPLRQGRLFHNSNRAQTPAVGLIDERMARQVFGTESPIGKRFRRYLPGIAELDPWTEIVGVVGHILNDNLEQDPRPQVYWPETQHTQDRGALVVRTIGNPENYIQAVVEQVHTEDPDQPVYDVRTMKQWVDQTMEKRSLMTGIVTVFGGASLLLACIGLYGVVSYTADMRLREFGIRIAIGSSAGQVRVLVFRDAAKLTLWGCALGLALSWPVSLTLHSLLFGITSGDGTSWFLAPALLIAVALLAGLGPARKAGRTDPAVALRAE